MTTTHTTLLSEAPGPSSPAHEKPSVTGTGALARSGRRAAAALLVALAAFLVLPLQAQAQTTYVSNIGQSENASALGISSFDQGQGFTTGTDSAGYVLASVDIKLESSKNSESTGSQIPTVTIVQGTPTGTVVATLMNPASLAANTTADYTFTAPANTTLIASTTYYVVMEASIAGISTARTTLDVEDSGGESDWSIADVSNWRTSSSNGSFSTNANALMIKVKGPGTTTLSTDATLSGLALADNSGTAITLSPSTFVSTTKSYTAAVANSIDEITITPTVNESNATYEIQNASGTALTDADTNTTGFQVDLTVGATTIKVEVTAEDTTTDTYQVTVTRATATPSPTHCETGDIWCANMTVAELTALGLTIGHGYNSTLNQGTLAPDEFEYDGTDYMVSGLIVTPGFDTPLRIGFDPSGEMVFNTDNFFLYVDGTAFLFDDATFVSGDQFQWVSARLNWSTGDTVELRLVERSGTAATGKPTISGTARVGQTLTADTSGIADADGLATVSYSYQ